MKYGNVAFFQMPRCLWKDEYKELSIQAKWLFVTLNELEHCFTNTKTDFFYRSNDSLVKDTGMSLSAVKRAKAELLETDLIESWQLHFIDEEKGNKSKKKITAYRILI